MIKIIETYSHKLEAIASISYLRWQDIIQINGIVTAMYVPTKLEDIVLRLRSYKTKDELDLLILKSKLKAVVSNSNGFLLITRHLHDSAGAILYKELLGKEIKLYSLILNGIPFYKDPPDTITIDKTVLGKMILIYDIISKIDKIEFVALALVINGIIESYTNTGVVSKKDLVWLNEIYSKYKRLGDLYD